MRRAPSGRTIAPRLSPTRKFRGSRTAETQPGSLPQSPVNHGFVAITGAHMHKPAEGGACSYGTLTEWTPVVSGLGPYPGGTLGAEWQHPGGPRSSNTDNRSCGTRLSAAAPWRSHCFSWARRLAQSLSDVVEAVPPSAVAHRAAQARVSLELAEPTQERPVGREERRVAHGLRRTGRLLG